MKNKILKLTIYFLIGVFISTCAAKKDKLPSETNNNEEEIKILGISADLEFGDKIATSASCDWENEQSSWTKQLNQAAKDFVEGKADISPTNGYCVHCHLASLCRVR